MKKICLVLLTLCMLGGFFITSAEAGQLCWQTDSTSDILDGYFIATVSGGKLSRLVHGVWYNIMYWPLAGNMVKTPDGSRWFLQLNTTYVGNYLGIVVNLDSSTLSGTGGASLIGDTFTEYDITFTSISCKAVPPYVPPTQ
jgi:hypothetical protein